MNVAKPVPMLDLKPQLEGLREPLEKALLEVLRSGHFILGPNVAAFEREFAEFLGVAETVGLSSGTDALVIGLRTLGVGAGDEVITTPFTFFATGEAILAVGATPVFADIDPETFCIDPAAVERAITPRTRALLPVHLFGHPADMDPLLALAEAHGLEILEDVAQAAGATYRTRKVGTLGAASAFSFYPSKNLGAMGDAGLLATNRPELAAHARRLRTHGQEGRYLHTEVGYTARLDEIQAALLRVKLPHVEPWNAGRRRAAEAYDAALRGVAGVTLPVTRPGNVHAFHQYTIRIHDGKREAVVEALASAQIASVVYYPHALHKMKPLQPYAANLPEAERAASEVLSLPLWPELPAETAAHIGAVIAGAVRR
jgi:dTDP-4-amino-4,6-dideoxygalactose transaminase